ncbi:rod shape-determining protein MreC [Amphibacillus sediminis]|uniref:rod shape-determining protein MreC n=1 Tax=Amphibacillus sediminis TaxID=360185 RepID=UPI0008327907|nr:rod shape-determining protein MreC [Amphibacillus sediminis]
MSFFRRKRLFSILLGLIIMVGLIGYSLSDRDELSAVEEFFQDVFGWTQQAFLAPFNYITKVVDNIDGMINMYHENQVLKENLAQYQRVLYEVQELRNDNEELMALLKKTESIRDYTPIQASIIARSPEQWFKQVTINKGKQDGISQDMAVITADGMIGKIQSASQFTSSVLLLNGFDRSNRIAVTVMLTEDGGEAQGFIMGFNEEREQLILEFTEYYDEIPEGESVFSSGLGGIFPRGLEIGTIEEVTTDQYGLTQIAYVQPSADMENLNHVIVVDRTMVTDHTPDDTEDDDDKSEEED